MIPLILILGFQTPVLGSPCRATAKKPRFWARLSFAYTVVVVQVESPPAAAGAGEAEDSLPEDEPSLDLELSDDDPLPLDDEDDSVEDSLLSELSEGRLGRP